MDTKKLRQKILDLAIHGKLVPQDPNDEPASVLLERIRAEKERLIAEGKIKRSKKSATSDTSHYENVPFEVPEGWCWCSISDICSKIGSGSTPRGSNYAEHGIPFFRSQNVYNDGLVYDDIKYISEDVHKSMIGTEVLPKDLLLNITGGSLGRCAVVPSEFERGNVSQHVCILRTVQVLPEYLHCFIISDYFSDTMILSGSGREGLPKYSLEAMMIPIPPLAEQSRIVSSIVQLITFVNSIEGSITDILQSVQVAKSKILDLAIHGKLVPQDPNDEPASELLKRINPKFVPCDNAHYENVPKGWCTIYVGDLAEYTNGKAFKPSDWERNGLPIIRIQNLNDENCQYNYTSITHEEKYRISHGDLLFAWAASLGVYIWQGNKAWLNQHIFKVDPHPFIDKQYLYYIFQYLVSEFYTRSHGSGMVHITKKEFETTIALLPPLSEQRRIVKSIKSYYTSLDNISANL
ncbi:MAG: restriction endonuclease subunit S [Alloprevotella sp.]